MRNMAVGFVALCLLIVSASVILQVFMPTRTVARIDTSMLQPGMNCKIGVVTSESSASGAYHGYCGIISQVNQDELILDDAIYQEISDSETRQKVGTVRVPIAEIAVIQHWGLPAADDTDGLERIGVIFR